MARMHSRKRGKSGSSRPAKLAVPGWLSYKPKEVEMLVVKLAKEENSPAKIGLILRDSYGIPDVNVITKKKITQILEEKNLSPELPPDVAALMAKSKAISKHLEENRQDKTALRGKQLTDSKVKRLVHYYKRSGVLPLDWKG